MKGMNMEYRHPQFDENGYIFCEINHPEHGWLPFTCRPDDMGRDFDTAALFEEMRPHAAPYVAPPLTEREARKKRNALLSASDWTQMPDAPVDKAAWATYRQALRDIPNQTGFPQEVVWPSKPA